MFFTKSRFCTPDQENNKENYRSQRVEINQGINMVLDNKVHQLLIGCSGFVGSILQRQTEFDGLYRSTNIADISGQETDFLICAGAPAQKWIANREPEQDKNNIEQLMRHLSTVRAKNCVLVSTVDVFSDPNGVDEDSLINEEGLHPYGLHRFWLEHYVMEQFPQHLIVRLPGLVGPGLRKNVIFDLHHHHMVSAIDSRAIFQFYPMVNLWYDIQIALRAGLRLVHLCAQPIAVGDVASEGFAIKLTAERTGPYARYDMQTRYGALFGVNARYQYNVRETIQAIRAYHQSEPPVQEESISCA